MVSGLALLVAGGAGADVQVGQIAIYDETILGEAAAIVDDLSVSIEESGAVPAFLDVGKESGVLGSLERPDVAHDCDVVAEWPAVSLYLTNVGLATSVYQATFDAVSADAQGAVDLAMALLDSVSAPPEMVCDKPIAGGISLLPALDLAGGPCSRCASRLKNIEVRLDELAEWNARILEIRQDAFQLVNAVVAKTANPGSFPPEDYACDRVRATNLGLDINSFRHLHDLSVESIANNAADCSLEDATDLCNECDFLQTNSLVGELGPILINQFASGGVQEVPPDPILVGVADALERAMREGDNPEVAEIIFKTYRRLRRLSEDGKVLHVVVPAAEEVTRTYVAVGRASMDEGDAIYDAVVVTAAQRDSGLPAPNLNDGTTFFKAARAFSRRLPVQDTVTFRDLEQNETLERLFPEWREFFR